MHDAFEQLQALGPAGELRGKERAVDFAVPRDAGKSRFDGRHGLAFIEAMHASIGIEHRDAGAREMRRRGRLAHADPTG
jgi:hypothetical protein